MRKIVIAGGSGFLGRMLAAHFKQGGRECVVLTRSPKPNPFAREVAWDGETLGPWADELEGAEALVNLAGRSVDCRYHARNRRIIMDSRVKSTQILGQAVARCANPPAVWLNSSTATIYKHSYDRPWGEDGEIRGTPEAKDIFSVEVAEAWERAFSGIEAPRTRKVAMRTAIVFGVGGRSVFPVMRRLVRLGLGGPMGGGRQYVSWIHQTDFCRAVDWLLERQDIRGVVNVAAPNPVPNRELMRLFRKACGVRIGLPAPRWLLEIGAFFLRTETELVIKSRRVVPELLLKAGFKFQFNNLGEAIDNLVGQPDLQTL